MLLFRLLKLFVVALVGGVVVVAGAYRLTYRSWPWQAPERVSWCGRHYDREGGAPVTAGRLDRPLTFVVFRSPPLVGRQVLTDQTRARVAARKRTSSTRGGTLYRRTGDGRYTVYELSGGP